MKCSICSKSFEGESHNPQPLTGKDCCSRCNDQVVLPMRLFQSGIQSDKALLITTETSVEFVKPKGSGFELEEIQGFVEGYIEIYPIRIPSHIVVVNEEGLILGMPFNTVAKLAFGIEAVGPVLICPKRIFE
jgi:hypothetical protein